jgi:hypothetical protein
VHGGCIEEEKSGEAEAEGTEPARRGYIEAGRQGLTEILLATSKREKKLSPPNGLACAAETGTGDLPMLFVEEYAHWLNLGTRELEFRPLSNIWGSSPKNWRLFISDPLHRYMQLQEIRLIDIRSKTNSNVANVFKPLGAPEYVHVTATNDGTLGAELCHGEGRVAEEDCT